MAGYEICKAEVDYWRRLLPVCDIWRGVSGLPLIQNSLKL